MLFVVLLTDKPNHGAMRAEQLPNHLGWLAAHKDSVLVAGALRHEPDEVPKGGLWVVQAESKEAVHVLAKTDPFFTCGLRERVDVFHWTKAAQDFNALL